MDQVRRAFGLHQTLAATLGLAFLLSFTFAGPGSGVGPLLLLALSLLIVAACAARFVVLRRSHLLVAGAFALATLLSVAVSESRASSWPVAWLWWSLLLVMVIATGWSATAWSLPSPQARSSALKQLGPFYAAAAIVLGAWAVVQMGLFGVRGSGPLLDPNNLATLNGALTIGALGVLNRPYEQQSDSTNRLSNGSWTWGVAILGSAGVGATGSRAGLVLFVLSLVILVLGVWRHATPRTLAHLRVAVVAVLVALLSFQLTHVQLARANTDAGTAVPEQASSLAASTDLAAGLEVRRALWRSPWTMFSERPWLGWGPGTFGAIYPAYRQLEDDDTAGNFAHNDALQLLAEQGIVGGIFWFVLAGWVGGALVRALVVRADRFVVPRLALVTSLAFVVAHSLVNFTFWCPPLLVVVGVSASLSVVMGSGRRGADATASEPPSTKAAWLRTAATALIGFALLYPLGVQWLAAGAVAAAEEAQTDRDRADALLQLNQVSDLGVEVPLAGFARAVLLQAQGEFVLADSAFVAAGAADPRNPGVLIEHARARFLLGDAPAAEALLRRALKIDPTDFRIHGALFRLLREEGRELAAYQLYRDELMPWIGLLAKSDRAAAIRVLERIDAWRRQFPLEPVVDGWDVHRARWYERLSDAAG